ncbi:MAG: tetratricopeptide repeat protein, partial [Proteobacteria bacterium]|nr:tetratricopeptide repeat protein [Pseudomonadota bacterium]
MSLIASSLCRLGLALAAVGVGTMAFAAMPDATDALAPGRAIRAQVMPGQHRDYTVSLAAGQAAELSLRQLGTHSVGLRRVDITEQASVQVDAGKSAMQRVTLIADETTAMRFAVTSKFGGEYEIALGAAHPITTADRGRARAQTLLAMANDLRRAAGSFEAGTIDSVMATRAAQAFHDALAAWQAVLDACEVQRTLSGRARLNFALGDYAQAQASARAALDSGCDRGGDPSRAAYAAEAERTLGASLAYVGDRLGAIAAQQRALALYRRTGDARFQGVVLGNLVADFTETGQRGRAFDAATTALKLAQDTSDAPGIAFSRERLAAVRMDRGEYTRALDAFAQTFEDLQRTPYAMVENMAWSDLGRLYRELGEPEQAVAAYQKSAAAALANKEPPAVAEALANQGDAALDGGRVDAAADLFTQAQKLGSSGGFARLQARVLRGLGQVALERRRWDEASEHLLAAQALAEKQGTQDETIEIELALGDLQSRRHRFAAARPYYTQALERARHTHASSKQPVALAALAQLEQRTGDLVAATGHIESALDLIESERMRLSNLRLRTSYFSSMRAYYELGIDILMQRQLREPHGGHAMAALQIAERARARSLQDQLTERGIDIRRDVDPTLLAREREAEDGVQAAAYELQRLSASASDAQHEVLRNALDAANAQLDRARAVLRESNPRYAELVRPTHIDPDALRRALLDDDTSVLEYWLGDARSYVFTIARDGIDAYVLPPRTQIEQAVAALHEKLIAHPAFTASVPMQRLAEQDAVDRAAIDTQARIVQERILPASVRARLRAQVAVVADGDLQLIPFALLPFARTTTAQPTSPPAFVYLPSLATLRSLRALSPPAAAPGTLAIFADPVFRNDDVRLRAQANAAAPEQDEALTRAMSEAGIASLRRLPNTRREAQAIAALATQTT